MGDVTRGWVEYGIAFGAVHDYRVGPRTSLIGRWPSLFPSPYPSPPIVILSSPVFCAGERGPNQHIFGVRYQGMNSLATNDRPAGEYQTSQSFIVVRLLQRVAPVKLPITHSAPAKPGPIGRG